MMLDGTVSARAYDIADFDRQRMVFDELFSITTKGEAEAMGTN